MKIYIFLFLSVFVLSCTKEEAAVDLQEAAQQVGDVMASVDESGGTSNGTMAFMESHRKTIVIKERKYAPESVFSKIMDILSPIKSAQAVACKDTSYSACTSQEKVRDLDGCTIGSSTFTGTITLSFNDASCNMDSNGDRVDRTPSFTVTGRRSATLTVSKTGTIGQRVTRASAGQFTFSNDGIRRVFSAGGTTLFDYTTQTTSDITVTGTSRSDRVMNGGNLRVTNNSSAVTCDYVPSNVTWSASCNCASSGSWTGTCSDGKTTSIDITGCGTATITMDEESEALSFDRCYSTN